MLHHADVPRVGLALGGIGRLEQSGDKRRSVRQPAGADKVAAMSRGGGEAMRVLTLRTGRTSMLAPARIRMAPVMTAVTSPNTSPRRPIVPRARRQYTLVLAIKSCTGAPSLSGMWAGCEGSRRGLVVREIPLGRQKPRQIPQDRTRHPHLIREGGSSARTPKHKTRHLSQGHLRFALWRGTPSRCQDIHRPGFRGA